MIKPSPRFACAGAAHAPPGLGRRRSHAAFTLTELLVSIAIFIMLGLLLVSLLRSGVEIWDRGEIRRDSYERAAILFDALRADLSCATIHREMDGTGVYPNFTCLPDKHGRARLWFTRVGAPQRLAPLVSPDADPTDTVFFPAPDRLQRHEVFYAHYPAAADARLYRGQALHNLDFGTSPSVETFLDKSSNFDAGGSLSPLCDGVLFLGFRFWSQKTRSWTDATLPGPEDRWDSTRFVDKLFPFKRRNLTSNDPLDDILPHRVEITVTLERPGAATLAATRLTADVSDDAKLLPADVLPNFPQGPGYARIDSEWILYERRTGSALMTVTRGVRGTKPVAHSSGAAVRWGDTFTTVVAIPAYKDDSSQ